MVDHTADIDDDLTPLQRDLALTILKHLKDEAAPVGARVSAPDLAKRFNVSRSPVSRALNLLVDQGILSLTDTRRMQVAKDVSSINIPNVVGASPVEDLYWRIMRERAAGELPRDVSEAELIQRFDVSRGVIRKVLMRFASEGLAQRLQGHGWRFIDSLHDEKSIKESYRFRIVVECAAFRSPDFQPDQSRIDQLRQAHQRILALGRRMVTASEWFSINSGFHESISSFSGNRYLVLSVQHQNNLRRMREAAIYDALPIERIRTSCEEHLRILDAIEEHNYEWAESLMREHLKTAGEL